MIEQSIQELIQYGIAKELVTEEDSIFLRNQLMDLLRLSSWETPALPEVLPSIDEILDKLVSYATENGIIADSNAARDLFDTRIMADRYAAHRKPCIFHRIPQESGGGDRLVLSVQQGHQLCPCRTDCQGYALDV